MSCLVLRVRISEVTLQIRIHLVPVFFRFGGHWNQSCFKCISIIVEAQPSFKPQRFKIFGKLYNWIFFNSSTLLRNKSKCNKTYKGLDKQLDIETVCVEYKRPKDITVWAGSKTTNKQKIGKHLQLFIGKSDDYVWVKTSRVRRKHTKQTNNKQGKLPDKIHNFYT